MSQPRVGTLVGTDEFGNEYYENKKDIVNRDRWVMYRKWDSDASQVPPEWHQWLSKFTDDLPTSSEFPKKPFFTPKFRENLTGTSAAFKTYSTTVSKIHAWEPRVKQR